MVATVVEDKDTAVANRDCFEAATAEEIISLQKGVKNKDVACTNIATFAAHFSNTNITAVVSCINSDSNKKLKAVRKTTVTVDRS